MSAQSQNSLEIMLCHQMAAAHFHLMKLLAGAQAFGLPPVEQAPLTNASARMMQDYQEGLLAMRRFRTGGRQTASCSTCRSHTVGKRSSRAVSAGARGPGGGARKVAHELCDRRRGWLKNGNSPGDLAQVRRSGARTRRQTACQDSCGSRQRTRARVVVWTRHTIVPWNNEPE